MIDLVGKTLGQYRIVGELGRGGMAIVYEAYQPSLNRAVAIKVLPQQFTFDKTFVQRFLQEARAAAKLEHPNIVAIHDVGEQDGVFYFVMQKLTGEPLNALLARAGHLSPARAAHIVAQVGAALDYAHRHGIVHRDIKPGNIIIGADDHATLTDFGIAKAAEGTQITQSGVVIGTPEYMSPEQATGRPVEPASDIYSLGIVLYQMLSGRVPFQADSTPALLYKQVYEPPAPLRGRISGLPPAVDEVLGKALAKDTTARFRSAGELADALQRAVEGLPVALPASAAPTVNAPIAQRSGRPLWAAMAGGAVGVVLVGALALKLLAGGNPAPSTWKPPDLPTGTVTQGLSALKPTATVTPSPLSTKPEPTRGKPQAQARQDIKVYAGPAANTAAAGQVAAGQRLDVIAKDPSGQWYRVCCVGAEPVWVEAAIVDVTGATDTVPVIIPMPPTAEPARAPTATPTLGVAELIVTSGTVNVRTGPGTMYPKAGELNNGAKLPITGRDNTGDWWQISLNGQNAWVHANLVSTFGATQSVAVVQAPLLPPTATPQSVCQRAPAGEFASIWAPGVKERIGCPVAPSSVTDAAYEPFERGAMIWRKDVRQHYTIFDSGGWQSFPDVWVEGLPDYSCPNSAPSQSPPTPLRGFGQIWCREAGVRQRIGNALAPEWAEQMVTQGFERGLMIQTSRGIYVLSQDGSWTKM